MRRAPGTKRRRDGDISAGGRERWQLGFLSGFSALFAGAIAAQQCRSNQKRSRRQQTTRKSPHVMTVSISSLRRKATAAGEGVAPAEPRLAGRLALPTRTPAEALRAQRDRLLLPPLDDP